MNNTDYDVIVVGAGVIGAAFAVCLAQRTDCRIALFEHKAELDEEFLENQRVFALGEVATSILDETRVFSKLKKTEVNRYTGMRVWDSESDGRLSFDARDYNLDSLGVMVDSQRLNYLLQQQLRQQASIDLFYQFDPKRLAFEHDGVTLFSNAHPDGFSSKLIVAADGANSWVRRESKIFAHKQSYEQKGVVAKIATTKPHQDIARQVFLATGPLAILPLAMTPDNVNQSSIVWSAESTMAEQLLNMSNGQFCQELQTALDDCLGKVSLLDQRQSFPLISQKSDQYFKRNVVLVGDAAHSIHPLAGQGANLGFNDIKELLDILSSCDISQLGDLAVLRKYEWARKADNEQTDLLMTGLHQTFKLSVPWWASLRADGMNLLDRSDHLKKMLASQAMGTL